MASKVDIINLAFVSLRTEPIGLPIEDTVNGRRAAAVYNLLLKALLREHEWTFAKKETALSLVDETPVFDDDFTYSYAIPSDYIRLAKTDSKDTYPYKKVGKRIYSNAENLKLSYIWFNTDPASYDDSFVQVFAAKIAAVLAYAITGNRALAKDLKDEFPDLLRIAKSINGQEETPDEPQQDLFINARV